LQIGSSVCLAHAGTFLLNYRERGFVPRVRRFAPVRRREVAMRAVKMIAASALLGLWAPTVCAADLAAEDAVHHVGETATVCGAVASAKFDAELQSQPTFLDFGKPYPDQVFTAVIFGADRTKFGSPEISLRGKRVCVTGKIQDQHGLPEIVLGDPKQLTQ
jgi:hypothetical protein